MAGCCVRCVLIFVSVLCMVSAIGDIMMGVVGRQVQGFGLDTMQAATGSSTAFWLITGVVTELAAIFGCCSLCCNNHVMVTLYAAGMLLLSAAKLVMGFLIMTSFMVVDGKLMAILLGHAFVTALVELIGAIVGFSIAKKLKQEEMLLDLKPLIPYQNVANPPLFNVDPML